MNNDIGLKYYKFIEGEETPIILRLVRIKNTELFVLEDSNLERVKLTKKQLSEFTILSPDSIVIFNTVGLTEDSSDVLITMHKYTDLLDGINKPYAVCRQNVIDLFTEATNRSSVKYIGCSMSIDTCPPDTDFDIMLACDKVIYSRKIACYIDDTLDDILRLVSPTKFDYILNRYDTKINKSMFIGSNKTLKDLMINTNFMYDYHKMFMIEEVNFKITTEQYNDQDEVYVPTVEQIRYVEGIIKRVISGAIIIKYNKDIDLESIKKSYILINDICNVLYLLVYIEGSKINREYDTIEDHRDKDLMEKSIGKV